MGGENEERALASIPRRFGRVQVDCAAVLAFPTRNAHPRIKGRIFQVGQRGCGVVTEARLFIGEECLLWATGGGHKYLGISGKIVWMKSVYENHEMSVVGIEFDKDLELTPDLLKRLGGKPQPLQGELGEDLSSFREEEE